MAIIQNLGAAFVRQAVQRVKLDMTIPLKKARDSKPSTDNAQTVSQTVKVPEEVKPQQGLPHQGDAANVAPESKRMTIEELAEQLRKINLTFDLFEVQAKFSTDKETGDIVVEVVNERTGEVIRRIPPYEISKYFQSIQTGDAAVTDVKA